MSEHESYSWIRGEWRYRDGTVRVYFKDGMTEIPVGRCRRGAFYLSRLGEDTWRVAPVRFPKNKREPYDLNAYHSDFICLVGAPEGINHALSQI